jgi:hypothetical protein
LIAGKNTESIYRQYDELLSLMQATTNQRGLSDENKPQEYAESNISRSVIWWIRVFGPGRDSQELFPRYGT